MKGFLGSAAGQLSGKALGVRDSFSLREALTSGLAQGTVQFGMEKLVTAKFAGDAAAAGSTAAAGSSAAGNVFGKLTGSKLALTSLGKGVQGAFSYAANWGAARITNVETTFHWGSFAASSFAPVAASRLTGMSSTLFGDGLDDNFGQMFASSAAAGFASTSVHRAFYAGGKMEWANLAYDSFGQVLGNAVADRLRRPVAVAEVADKRVASEPQPLTASSEPQDNVLGRASFTDEPGLTVEEALLTVPPDASFALGGGQQIDSSLESYAVETGDGLEGIGNGDEDRITRKAFISKDKNGKLKYQDEKGRFVEDPRKVFLEDRAIAKGSVRYDAELNLVENELFRVDSGTMTIVDPTYLIADEGMALRLGGVEGRLFAEGRSAFDIDLADGEVMLGVGMRSAISASYAAFDLFSDNGSIKIESRTVAEAQSESEITLSAEKKRVGFGGNVEAVLLQTKVKSELAPITLAGLVIDINGEAVGNLGGLGVAAKAYAENYKTRPGVKFGGMIGLTPGVGGAKSKCWNFLR